MRYTVRFRFNKITGEVEEFLVDQETHLESVEHNQLHEKNTGELASLLARFHEIDEIPRAQVPPLTEDPPQDDETIGKDAGRTDRSEQ